MTQLQAADCFLAIWSFWPNQDDRGGSFIGFKYVATTEKLDAGKLILCAKAYCGEVDVEYCHRLGNWIRDGVYQGFYQMDDEELQCYVNQIEFNHSESKSLVEAFNQAAAVCSRFYPCLAVDDRLRLIMKAMRNKFFRENWKEALRKLFKLMKQEFDANDPRNFIKPTVQWFCQTSPEKHSVAKVMEGEYGKPARKKKSNKIETEMKKDFTSPEQALEYFNEI